MDEESEESRDWSSQSMLEITLKQPEDFLKVKETLTRMGVASKRGNTLWQSAHILHKRGKYYIVHFKELFLLDGRTSSLSHEDIARRNSIAFLLQEWELLTIVSPELYANDRTPATPVRVLTFTDKKTWNLIPKYRIGAQHEHEEVSRVRH